MPSLRMLALAAAVFILSAGFIAEPAHARTHHTRHHKSKSSKTTISVRAAQRHLANLGYYQGKVDGVSGPGTRAAIRSFQRDNHMKATGKLTAQTYSAIVRADGGDKSIALKRMPLPGGSLGNLSAQPPQDFYAEHPDYYGHYDPNYANPMQFGSPQAIYSRYAKLALAEQAGGSMRHYNLTINGEALAQVDGQPAVINVSQTFMLATEDAIIFTAYEENNLTCRYKHFVLAISDGSYSVHEIENCTHDYQARMNNGSLFITFGEADNGRPVGSTWRYERGYIQKL